MKLCSALFLVLALSPALAAAQEAQEAYSLDPVTVTAGKRQAEVREVPASISVIGDLELEEAQAWDLRDVSHLTPNFHLKTTTSGNALVIRGLSTIDTSLHSPAGLYVDDVAYPLNYMQNLQLLDVERIEVLRGPQGALYGANTEAGVVNVVLRQPDNETRARIFSDLASYDTYRLGASVSGPIAPDQIYLGGAFLWSRSDGFVENAYKGDDQAGEADLANGRGALRYTPNPRLDLSLALDANQDKRGLGAMRYETGKWRSDRYVSYSNAADTAEQSAFGQSLRAKYQADGLDLASITSHRDFRHEFIMDADRTAMATGYSDMDLSQESWSQELRLASRAGRPLNWLVGAYAAHDRLDVRFDRPFTNAAMASKLRTDSEQTSCAAFSQAIYAIRPDLRLTAGLRLDSNQQSGNQTYISQAGAKRYAADLDSTELLPSVSLAHDLNQHLTAYTTWSRGYLSGGYNYFSSNSSNTLTYDPEHTTSYEVGLKTAWLGNRLEANLALFHMDITDKQVREEAPGGGISAWKFGNAARATSQGGELEMKARPWGNLILNAGLGYATTEIHEWVTTESGQRIDYQGKALPWAPDLTYNLGAAYHHASGLFARADLFGGGRQYFDAANTLSQDGYQLVGLVLGYTGERLGLWLWVKNLLDTEYAFKRVRDSSGNVLVEDGDPRVVGVTLEGRF